MDERQEALVRDFRKYATKVAIQTAKNLPKGVLFEQDDIIQVAQVGLIEAAIRFNPDKKDPQNMARHFKAFAQPRISGAVIDECRRLSFIKRRGQEKGMTAQIISLDWEMHDENGTPMDNYLAVQQDDPDWKIDFRDALKTLSEREQQVVVCRLAGYSCKEVGEIMDINEARVSQIGTEARLKILELTSP